MDFIGFRSDLQDDGNDTWVAAIQMQLWRIWTDENQLTGFGLTTTRDQENEDELNIMAI